MRDSAPVATCDTNAFFNLWMTPFVALNSLNPFLGRRFRREPSA